MAVSLFAHEVSDICLGKPALKSLPVSATVADALSALKRSGETFLSVWSCDCGSTTTPTKIESEFDHEDRCRCVDKVCMVDVVSFLCSNDDNLNSPSSALQSPLSSALPPKVPGRVRHLHPTSSLLEAIDLILEGAQNLVVPIGSPTSRFHTRRKHLDGPSTLHNGREFCWLTQEDVIRFLLNSIAAFSPTPAFSIQSLGIIDPVHGLTVHCLAPALSALPAVARSLVHHTSVPVVDDDGRLFGEVSPLTVSCCDETAAAAASAELSVGDLMAYIDCGGSPPEDLVWAIKAKLEEKKLGGMIELMEEDGNSGGGSSDEEFGLLLKRAGSRRVVRGSAAIACFPRSSLAAVMIQALAHRVSCVWVVQDDYSLVGMVTFAGILKVFREHI